MASEAESTARDRFNHSPLARHEKNKCVGCHTASIWYQKHQTSDDVFGQQSKAIAAGRDIARNQHSELRIQGRDTLT
ncbi:MAG: DUF2188 domain-containing protein [Verrucomicrobia bacterium]|nr:DUF2188 domain-containing protein [Verrucomicrobiota bacterium]